MNTSIDNLNEEGFIDNVKKLRKTGKEIENMTKPVRKGIVDAGKGLVNKGKSDINKFKKSQEVAKRATNIDNIRSNKVVKQSEVSKKAADFTKTYNKTKNVTVPKAKKTPITPAMKEKAFKQSFGKPTGADPTTGKGTYKPPKNITNRNLYVDKAGKPTPKGIDKYITNRNTKGKFKGADIKPDTVSKGLEKTVKDIKNPTVRKSTASQIQSKYGGRRAETSKTNGFKAFKNDPAVKVTRNVSQARVDATKDIKANVKSQGNTYTPKYNKKRNELYSDPWDDNKPNMKVKNKTPKSSYSRLDKLSDTKLATAEKIAPPTRSTSKIKGKKNFKVFRVDSQQRKVNKQIAAAEKASKSLSRSDVNPGSSIVPYDKAGAGKSGGLVPKKGGSLVKGLLKGKGSDLVTTNNTRRPKGGPLTVTVPDNSKLTVNDTKPGGKLATVSKPVKPKSLFPKKGWASKGLGRQSGAISALSTFSNEKSRGKGNVRSAIKSAVVGTATGLGTWAGAKYGGAAGAAAGGTLASAAANRGFEIASNVGNVTKKSFNKFRSTVAPDKKIKLKPKSYRIAS